MSAQEGQKFDIEKNGDSIRYRQYTSGGTALWNYYPVSNIKCIEPVAQIGFGARSSSTNQRLHRTFQDDLLRITISFLDDTKPLVFDIQNVMNQGTWTPNVAGMAIALLDINGWVVNASSSSSAATLIALLAAFNAEDFATQTTSAALLNELQLKADLTEVQPVTLNQVNGSPISLGQNTPANSLPIVLPNVTSTGTITTQNLVPAGAATAGSAVELTLNGYSNVAIQTTGTYTGALTLQGTVNGTTWVTFGGTPLINTNTGGVLATITSALQSTFQAEVGGFLKVRVTGLAAVTGTATVTLIASQASTMIDIASIAAGSNVIGQVTQSGTWTVMPGNTPNTSPWLAKLELGTSSLSTSTSLNSAAGTNATSLKNTAGLVGFISVNNTTITPKYFRLFNKASAPTVGTDIPFLVVTIPASSSKEVPYSNGLEFAAGIAYAITGGATTTDSTAVAAGDVQLNITWQ